MAGPTAGRRGRESCARFEKSEPGRVGRPTRNRAIPAIPNPSRAVSARMCAKLPRNIVLPTAMKLIQILGARCAKCYQLHKNAQAAVDELGANADVELVTEIEEIVEFGVLMTPALAVDGVVKLVGRVPSVEELKTLLR
jgi:small redox-active disulfide protein 2